MKVHLKTMPIVIYLGSNIKEYQTKSENIIKEALSEGNFCCEFCLKPMRYHSCYDREIKETGEILSITMIWCRKCKNWHSLQPDFLLPNKHYSGNEIESVIIDSAIEPINYIDTVASESTVRRWIKQISGRIKEAIGKLKHIFRQAGKLLSEIAIDTGHCYGELEQVLEMAPYTLKHSGNKLGMANIWLMKSETPTHI